MPTQPDEVGRLGRSFSYLSQCIWSVQPIDRRGRACGTTVCCHEACMHACAYMSVGVFFGEGISMLATKGSIAVAMAKLETGFICKIICACRVICVCMQGR